MFILPDALSPETLMPRLRLGIPSFAAALFAIAIGSAQPKKGSDLDAATHNAFKKLGAHIVSYQTQANGSIELDHEKYDPTSGRVPVFTFAMLDEKVLAKLPKSEATVGLNLRRKGNDKNSDRIGEAALKHLSNLKNLHILCLGGTSINDSGLKEVFAICKELTHLELANMRRLSSDALQKIDQLKNLKVLDLSRTQTASDLGVRDLRSLKELRSLNLEGGSVSEAGAKDIAELKQLQFLNLNGNRMLNDAAVSELLALDNLRNLLLANTKVTDAGLKGLGALPALNHLDLARTKISDDGLKHVASIRKLEHLDLTRTEITDDGLKEIAKIKTLKALHVGKMKIRDAGVKELAALTDLEELALDETEITDSCLKDLLKLPLKHISLNDTDISDAGLKDLAKIKTLKQVSVVKCKKVTKTGLAALKQGNSKVVVEGP
jgi:Leucine-rich repeat (LRR) protein